MPRVRNQTCTNMRRTNSAYSAQFPLVQYNDPRANFSTISTVQCTTAILLQMPRARMCVDARPLYHQPPSPLPVAFKTLRPVIAPPAFANRKTTYHAASTLRADRGHLHASLSSRHPLSLSPLAHGSCGRRCHSTRVLRPACFPHPFLLYGQTYLRLQCKDPSSASAHAQDRSRPGERGGALHSQTRHWPLQGQFHSLFLCSKLAGSVFVIHAHFAQTTLSTRCNRASKMLCCSHLTLIACFRLPTLP